MYCNPVLRKQSQSSTETLLGLLKEMRWTSWVVVLSVHYLEQSLNIVLTFALSYLKV